MIEFKHLSFSYDSHGEQEARQRTETSYEKSSMN